MRRIVVLLPALAFACAAIAQDIPDETAKDFWCGIAFELAARDVPVDAAPEVLSVTDPYKQGAEMLVGRAEAVYLENGYTAEAFETLKLDTGKQIAAELASTDPNVEPAYSFEDCAALIGR